MAAPVPLRSDYDPARLRALARQSRDPDQTRRLLALASIYDGASRSEAAALGGVGLQTVRDWVLRFNQDGPAGLLNAKAPGPRPLLDEVQRDASAATGRGRADSGDPRRGALAADRPDGLGLRGVQGVNLQADDEPGAARARLAQALGPA